MRARRTASVVVLALFLVTAAALAASGPALSVSSYRSRANAICARERVETLSRLHAAKNLAQYLDDEVPVLRSALTALNGLNPPRQLASLDAQVVTTVRGEVTVFTTLAGQAKAGKLTPAQWQRNPTLARLGTHELALWKQIGATTCANP
jgi:hypothetical protein